MIRSPNVRLGLALVLVLGLAATVSANETKGTIRSVNAEKNEVVLKGILNDTTYEINKDARVCLDGKKAKIGDLREGDHVTIELQKAGDTRSASEVRALRKSTETTGTVRRAISETHQLVVKGLLKDATYNLEKGAVVWLNGKEGSLADLREGDHVRITYEQRGEQYMASAVVVTRK